MKPGQVVFKWNEGHDAETATSALRYAVSLQRSNGDWYFRPGATSDGKRLLPNLEGTVPPKGYPLGYGSEINYFNPDLRLAAVQYVSSLPSFAASLVVVALVGADRHLHIRLFENSGILSRDLEESSLPDGPLKTELKAFLTGPAIFPNVSTLTPEQRQWIIASARTLTGHTSYEYVFEQRNSGGTRMTLPDGTYRWSVQAIDTAFAGSPFSAESTFTVLTPPVANPDTFSTPTNTPTATPAGIVNGHLTWQGISQPNNANNGVTATLLLDVGE